MKGSSRRPRVSSPWCSSNIVLGTTTFDKEVEAGRAKVAAGSKDKVDELLGLLVRFDPLFNIVTP